MRLTGNKRPSVPSGGKPPRHRPPGGPVVQLQMRTRYLTFEYLPRTAANLALTDIRAQHPDAIGP